jgi:hypothetical protein
MRGWFQSGAETSDEAANSARINFGPNHRAKAVRGHRGHEIERLRVGGCVDQEVAGSKLIED